MNNKTIYLFFTLFNITHAFSIHVCSDINDLDNCISNWNCMWCNNSYIENNTIVHDHTCNTVNPCFLSQENNKNCLYNDEHKYELQCKIGTILQYLLLFVGYYCSLIVIYGTLNKIILKDIESKYLRNSLNTFVLILNIVPIFIAFFMNELVFNFLFTSYVFSAIFIYCCIQAEKKYTKETYTAIN